MRIFGSGFFLVVILLVSCQQEAPSGPLTFFDLSGFLDQELSRLGGQQDVVKTVIIDGVVETQVLHDYAWTSEMNLLRQWDINRPAWRDQYSRDTLYQATRMHLKYQCLDEDLQVRSMDIWQTGEVVDSIHIEMTVDNPLRTTKGVYRYVPARGLDFRQVSSRRFGSEQDLSVSLQLASALD